MASKAAPVLGILLSLCVATRVALADGTSPGASGRSMASCHCSCNEKRSFLCHRLCDLPESQDLVWGKACLRRSEPAPQRDPASHPHPNRSYGPETARHLSHKPKTGPPYFDEARDTAAGEAPDQRK
jgi:hypothetical protein